MTASGQMYLKAVYYLSKHSDITHVADIAQALEVKCASASNALKSLASGGYVAHKTYGDVKLTAKGYRAALDVIRVDERMRQYCYCE